MLSFVSVYMINADLARQYINKKIKICTYVICEGRKGHNRCCTTSSFHEISLCTRVVPETITYTFTPVYMCVCVSVKFPKSSATSI